jgi:hypothetical protein
MAHHRAATTLEQRERFLAKLAEGLTITDACRARGVRRHRKGARAAGWRVYTPSQY